jgi:mycarose O-acyltransferase
MRFIAALMVFFFHADIESLFSSNHALSTYSTVFVQGGWTGVDFFFILSGFVLTWSARSTDTAPKFWRRRFFKIYPNHVVTFLAAFALLTWVSNTAINTRIALANLLLIHSWFPQLDVRVSVNDVTWSLSCEALFYLSFPLLFRLVKKIRPQRLWAWAIGTAVCIFLVPVLADALFSGGTPLPLVRLSNQQMWFIYQFPPVRCLDFVFGMILARIVAEGRRLPLDLGGAIALVVASYAVAPLFPAAYGVVAVTAIPLGLVIAAGAAADVENRPTILSSRLMVWLGEVSFAFYMCHRQVLVYVRQWLGHPKGWGTPTALAVLALLFLATLAVSALLYSLVERPMMRRFATSRRDRVRRATAAPESAEVAGEDAVGVVLAGDLGGGTTPSR